MRYLNLFVCSFVFYFACVSLFPLVFIGEKNIEHGLLRAFQNNNFLKKVFFCAHKIYVSFKDMDFKCSAPFIVNYPDVLAITTFFISSLLLALRNHKKEIFEKMYLQFSSEMWSPFIFLPNHTTFMLPDFPFSKSNSTICLKALIIPSSLWFIFLPGSVLITQSWTIAHQAPLFMEFSRQ